MTRKALFLLAFACLWSAVGKGQQIPVSVTVQTTSTETQAQTPEQAPVGLDDLIREAVGKNPGVQSALRQVEALRHRVPQAKTLPDPQVSAGWAGNIKPFSVQKGRSVQQSRHHRQPNASVSRQAEIERRDR